MSKFLKSNNEKGNTVVTFEGNLNLLERLLELQESGELEKILGVPVLEIDASAIAKPKRSLDVKMPSFSTLLNDISLRNTSVDDWNFDIAMINTRRVRQNYQGNINRINTRGSSLRSSSQGDNNQASSLTNLGGVLGFIVGTSAIGAAYIPLMGAYIPLMREINLIGNCINLINHSDKDMVKVIALELGNSNEKIPSIIINALADRIKTIDDQETAWQLALTLGKLDPEHPLGAVGQTKTIEFPTDDWFDLFLALRVGEDDLIDVLIEVTSATDEYLPVGLQVSLLDETEELFSEAIAKEEERYLSLEFTGAIGQFFSVNFSLGGNDLSENFVI
jgi:Protein of unknown function (DUF1822)